MWELVRNTERFSFVPRAKVEHAVFYPDTEGPEPPGIWYYEVAAVMGMMVTGLRVVTARTARPGRAWPRSGGGRGSMQVCWGPGMSSSPRTWTRC